MTNMVELEWEYSAEDLSWFAESNVWPARTWFVGVDTDEQWALWSYAFELDGSGEDRLWGLFGSKEAAQAEAQSRETL